jgi:hypothetical protein
MKALMIIAALMVCTSVKADPPVIVHCDESGVCVVVNPATGEESIVIIPPKD